MDADTETHAGFYASKHAREHQRQGVFAEMRVYPLPWWRRFLDWDRDQE
jgi:hypothetical protein